MELVIDGTSVDKPIDNSLIEESIRSMTGEGDSFVILSKDEMTYLQTSGGPTEGYILEYQEGTLEEHYSCVEPSLDTEQAVRIFQCYLSGDSRWRTDYKWEKGGFGSSPIDSRHAKTFVFIGVLIALFAVWKFFLAT